MKNGSFRRGLRGLVSDSGFRVWGLGVLGHLTQALLRHFKGFCKGCRRVSGDPSDPSLGEKVCRVEDEATNKDL